MDLALDIAEFFGVILFLWIILFTPVPGVSNDASVEVRGNSYNVELLNSSKLPEGDYWGSHDLIINDIRLATGWLPTYQFMSTCSHEVQHLEYEINEAGLTTEEEHQKMSGLGSKIIPWNWEIECVRLLPARFGL